MPRATRVLLAACVAFALGGFAGPATALASSASKSGSTVTVTGAAGEANNLTIATAGINYRITESGAGVTLTAGAGCAADIFPNQVLCPNGGVTSLVVNAGDAADTVSSSVSTASILNGGEGVDRLNGGPGNETLNGDLGDDVIDSVRPSGPSVHAAERAPSSASASKTSTSGERTSPQAPRTRRAIAAAAMAASPNATRDPAPYPPS